MEFMKWRAAYLAGRKAKPVPTEQALRALHRKYLLDGVEPCTCTRRAA
jgi:hypothetical protein